MNCEKFKIMTGWVYYSLFLYTSALIALCLWYPYLNDILWCIFNIFFFLKNLKSRLIMLVYSKIIFFNIHLNWNKQVTLFSVSEPTRHQNFVSKGKHFFTRFDTKYYVVDTSSTCYFPMPCVWLLIVKDVHSQ